MRMSQDHYGYIYNAIKQNRKDISLYKESLKKEASVKNIEARLRWDLLYIWVGSRWVCDNLYTYLNDDHIDTALRRIFKELNHEN